MQKYTKYILHNNAELLIIKEHAEIFGNETISRLEDEKDSLREAKRIADEYNAQRRCKPREQGKKRKKYIEK